MLEKLQAIHPGHHHVEQDDAWPLETVELLERLESIPRRCHPPPTVAQHLGERLTDVLVVIDDENARRGVHDAPRYARPAASRSDASCASGAQLRKTCGLAGDALWEGMLSRRTDPHAAAALFVRPCAADGGELGPGGRAGRAQNHRARGDARGRERWRGGATCPVPGEARP